MGISKISSLAGRGRQGGPDWRSFQSTCQRPDFLAEICRHPGNIPEYHGLIHARLVIRESLSLLPHFRSPVMLFMFSICLSLRMNPQRQLCRSSFCGIIWSLLTSLDESGRVTFRPVPWSPPCCAWLPWEMLAWPSRPSRPSRASRPSRPSRALTPGDRTKLLDCSSAI